MSSNLNNINRHVVLMPEMIRVLAVRLSSMFDNLKYGNKINCDVNKGNKGSSGKE